MTNTLTLQVAQSRLGQVALDSEGKLFGVAHLHITDNKGAVVTVAQRVQLEANSTTPADTSLTAAQITSLKSMLATIVNDAAGLQGFV